MEGCHWSGAVDLHCHLVVTWDPRGSFFWTVCLTLFGRQPETSPTVFGLVSMDLLLQFFLPVHFNFRGNCGKLAHFYILKKKIFREEEVRIFENSLSGNGSKPCKAPASSGCSQSQQQQRFSGQKAALGRNLSLLSPGQLGKTGQMRIHLLPHLLLSSEVQISSHIRF